VPSLSIRQAGAWPLVNALSIRQGGAWVDVQSAWVMQGGSWQQVYQRTPTIDGTSALVTFAPCDGGGQMNVSWVSHFAPPGATWDVIIATTDSTFGFHGDSFFSVADGGGVFNTSLCPDSTGTVTINMRDSGGTLIASDVAAF
jgi:hypothetical protein